jgi:hypothetical protein
MNEEVEYSEAAPEEEDGTSTETQDQGSTGLDAIDISFLVITGTACIILLAFFIHKFFGRFKAKINVGKTGIEFEDLPDEDKN